MIDLNALKENPIFFEKQLKRKNFNLNINIIIKLEENKKKIQSQYENLQFYRKKVKNRIIFKKKIYKNILFFKNQLIELKINSNELKYKLKEIKKKIIKVLSRIPNIPDVSIPNGINDKDNCEIYQWGKKRIYNFKIRDHVYLGNYLNGFDWKSSSLISGSGFPILKNNLAKLYRILGQFMLDVHTQIHGYKEINVPFLVNEKCMYGTGQIPVFKNDLFSTYIIDQKKKKKIYFLIPTAEVPLINLLREKIVKENDLPIKLTSLSSCFRAEKFSYGQQTRGLIRNYQFEKVEIVQIVKPKESKSALEEITNHAEKILKLLKLPYRKVSLCSGSLGFSSKKTYDLEVWFPSSNSYREVSSCSMIGDFQSRRTMTKYKDSISKKNIFVHTLNGSGLAVGRTLAAILENYQYFDKTIKIPKILRSYYKNNVKFLKKD